MAHRTKLRLRASRQRDHRKRRFFEALERRLLLTFSAEFSGGLLTIDIDDASPAEVSVDSGKVLVNGVAPVNNDTPGSPVAAADVTNVGVTAAGAFDNDIDLSAVTPGNFPNFQAAQVHAGDGNDEVDGTSFDDRLFGESGNDVIRGGGGSDLVVGGDGSDDLSGGEDDDLLDGGGQISVTVTNLSPVDGTLVTPVFLATADGVYDFFDSGSAASASLERLAEDGTTGPRIAAALATGQVAEAIATPGGPLAPGDSRTVEFDASALDDLAQYLSYASMVIPSNDAFIGNDDPQQLDLFDVNGNLIHRVGANAFIVAGTAVWDAGTEVNDEIPANTAALGQTVPDTGVPEGGVVHLHPGFQGSLGLGGPVGNILTTFPGADFTTPGYEVLSIEVTNSDGNDTIRGDGGNDELLGGEGDDRLFGGEGNDTIAGQDGDDLALGGFGDDDLSGGPGNDSLDGAGQIKVTVTNRSPATGTLVTPVFLATADGVYDFFNNGSAASASLERLAEDGNTGPRIAAALATGQVANATATPGGPLSPGDFRTIHLDASALDGLSQYLSYASMVIPSNDAFIANDDPQQIDLFDADGDLIHRVGAGAVVVGGGDVWDAGTEVNDEIPANTAALAQAAPDTGVPEGGVVHPHRGFQGSLSLGGPIGNILTAIPGGDFTLPGYEVLSIEVTNTDGNDTLRGDGGDDELRGGDGDDELIGGAGDDNLNGGEGDDTLEGDGRIAVTLTNLAPVNGTLLTPVFLTTADGAYDFFDAGSPASASLESLAEDGDTSGRIAAALATGQVDAATATPGGPLFPGEMRTVEFDVSAFNPLTQFLSYASMVIPSNDAFVANDDPQQIGLFDANGNVIGRQGASALVVAGSEVWDAGTEVNDEIPANTAALAQAAPNTGVDENGVVHQHAGFQGSLGFGGPIGNVLDAIPGGDFTMPGYQVLSIEIIEIAGNDELIGGGGDDEIIAGAGDDVSTWNHGDGNDDVEGGAGDDRQVVNGDDRRGDTFRVSESRDRLEIRQQRGGPARGCAHLDVAGVETAEINGRGGNDRVFASNLEDVADLALLQLGGQEGRDRLDASRVGVVATLIDGGPGRDVLRGGSGDDDIFGGSESDIIYAGLGDDFASGGTGNDRINGGGGADTLRGDDGRDFIRGGWGEDDIDGGDGNDRLFGGADNDVVRGGDGHDFIFGQSGDDELFGDAGNDVIFGGLGDDLLRGGLGFDFLFGGPGNDDEQQD